MTGPIAAIDRDHDRERLELLRASLLALRIPVLLMGLMLLVLAVLSILGALANLFMMFGVSIGSGVGSAMDPYLLFSAITSVLFVIFDLVVAGTLTASGALGFAARTEPRHLLRSVKLLFTFWLLFGLRIVVSILSTGVSMVFMWSMFL